MARFTRLATLAALALTLVGCGVPGNQATIQASSIQLSQVYSVGGQPQLIVKRKAGVLGLDSVSHVRKVRQTALPGVEVQAVTDGQLAAAIDALRADPSVEYVEPNYKVSLPEAIPVLRGGIPRGDKPTAFQGAYGPKLVAATEAHAKTTGEGQIIAVVDTGVDLTHPDFAGKLVPGVNTCDAKGVASDDQGHGTNCAGIAASLQDKEQGFIGIAPGAKIMPVKVLSADGSGSDASVAEGIRWAADHGATVISLSLGGSQPTQTGAEAVKYALAKGAVLVAAMGNNGTGQKSYPAAYPGVLAVGATDINDKVTSFSQYGSWISVTAPGYSILSTMPTYKVSSITEYEANKESYEKYGMRLKLGHGYMTGTSQACPHVAGLAALVRAAHPELNAAQVKARIETAAAKQPGMNGKDFEVHYGFGRINALKSL